MPTPVTPALWVLGCWVVCAPLLVGVGRAVSAALREEPGSAADGFWLGAAGLLIALQWWHLVLPISTAARVAVLVAASWGAVVARAWRARPTSPGAGDVALGLAVLAVGAWLALRACGPPQNDDSGGYHLGAIRWATEYPAVPGVGNVHPFLAVNHGAFLLFALLDFGPFAHGSHHVLNGLLALGLLATCLGDLRAAARAPARAAAAAALAPWVVWTLQSPDVANGSSDVAEVCLGAAFVLRWAGAAGPASGPRAWRGVVLLATALVVTKLSSVGALAGLALALLLTRWAEGRTFDARGTAAAVGLGLIPWSVSCVIKSGYWPFPGGLLAFPVDWRLPERLVVEFAGYTLAYGRGPGARAGQGPGWLWTRLEELGSEHQGFVLPVALGALAGGLALALARGRAQRAAVAALLLPAAAAVAFWLGTSPRLRYAGIFLQGLGALGAAALAAAWPPRARAVVLGVALLGALRVAALVAELDFGPPAHLALGAPVATGHPARTDSGLAVFVADGHLCWAAELPCVPALDPKLSARRTGELRAGFRLDADLSTYEPPTMRYFRGGAATPDRPGP